jgi:hypothetical protein
MLTQIFRILSEDLYFLFTLYHFETLKIEVYNHEIDASVSISNGDINILLGSSGQQLQIGIKKTVKEGFNPDYFGIDIIKHFFENSKFESSMYQYSHSVFLKTYLPKIILLFKDENYLETKKQLEIIEKERTKKLHPNWK